MSYEDAMKELETIITKLDSTTLPLKEALSLFERANELAKIAQEELSKTTGKLFMIKQDLTGIVEEEQ